jgi:hypothetical protein
MRITLLLTMVLLASPALGEPIAFAPQDIESAKNLIREQYKPKANVVVNDVEFVQTNARRLDGFAKIQISGAPYTVSCTAIMGDDGHYLAKCGL